LPRKDHVWITTDQLVRFHKNKFDEMLYKLESTIHVRLKHAQPCLEGGRRITGWSRTTHAITTHDKWWLVYKDASESSSKEGKRQEGGGIISEDPM